MSRKLLATGAALAAALALTAGPAAAQTGTTACPYGQVCPPDSSSTTSSSSSSTTEAPATTLPREDKVAEVSDNVVEPGDPITMESAGVFAPGSTATVAIVRGQQGADPVVLDGSVVVNADGSVTVTVTVPEGTPAGIYFVYIQGVDADGNPVRVLAVVAVMPSDGPGGAAAVAAGGSGDDAPEGSGSDGSSPAPAPTPGMETPPEVQQLQVTPDAEQALLDEVAAANGDVSIEIDGERIAVTSGDTGSSSSASLAAGLAAAALAAGGAVALRRRRA